MEKYLDRMEDPEDVGLKAVMGNRFRDMRTERKPQNRSEKTMVSGVVMWCVILVIIGFWYRSGQMAPSAAIPSMVVCAFAGGCRIGKGK